MVVPIKMVFKDVNVVKVPKRTLVNAKRKCLQSLQEKVIPIVHELRPKKKASGHSTQWKEINCFGQIGQSVEHAT